MPDGYEETLIYAFEVRDYAKCVASQISGVPFDEVVWELEDWELAVRIHELVEREVRQ